MLFNYKKSLFNFNSSTVRNIERQDLSQQVTNNNLNLPLKSFPKNPLSAKWEIEDGKLVCKWLIN
ncbi:MAG: hypothetical protein KME54_15065 [Tolypothrix brevis GSE-NOS-MK-07-07A]|jgi:hypothetical protein|nr:hypothetical protein [Tolypothrix brevis GSE-NOS-MK-07-07A]